MDGRNPRGARRFDACGSAPTACRSRRDSVCIFKQHCSHRGGALRASLRLHVVARSRSCARVQDVSISVARRSESHCDGQCGTPQSVLVSCEAPSSVKRRLRPPALSSVVGSRVSLGSCNAGLNHSHTSPKKLAAGIVTLWQLNSGFGWQTRTTLHRKLIRHRRSQT